VQYSKCNGIVGIPKIDFTGLNTGPGSDVVLGVLIISWFGGKIALHMCVYQQIGYTAKE
jgi:hypothetical protein